MEDAHERATGRHVRATLVKDIRLEWRSKDAINSMLFFALLVVVIFSFSFDPTAEESRQIAGGLVWVAFLFAAVVALNQTWARELRNQVLDAYRVSPAPANSLFLAKALGNFIFVTRAGSADDAAVRRVLQPARARSGVAVDSGCGAGNVGAGGERHVFCGHVAAHAQPRDHVAAACCSRFRFRRCWRWWRRRPSILTGDETSAKFWIVLLATYDVVFTTACLLLFETVLHAE